METKALNEVTSSLEAAYCAATPCSQEWFARVCGVMPGGAKGGYFYKPYPLTMVRGEGCYLYDVDGRRYVDFANHHTAQILGHNHPAVMEAVRRQLERGIVLGAPVGVEAELAEELVRRVPSLEQIRFCNSGTEATLHAIRLARGFSGRPKIAKFEGGYHGSHDVVEISVTPSLDSAGPDSAPYSVPTAGGISPHASKEVVVLPYDDEPAVERLLRQHRRELACVIFEPRAGILAQRREFIQALHKMTQSNDILLILDEVASFRVGPGGMQEYCGITPDLTTFGKIIGGGFPVGAFGGRADIMGLLDGTQAGFSQSGTFSAHPVAMAAGLATLKQLTPEAFAHLNTLGDRLCAGLKDLFDQKKQIAARAVGIGSMFGIHFTEEEVTHYRALARTDKTMVRPVYLALLEQGYYPSHVMCMNTLSLPMDASHVDGFIEALGNALDRVTGRSTIIARS